MERSLLNNKEAYVPVASAGQADAVIRSEDIFGTKKMVLIQHKNDLYRLMITKQGKLILTK